MRKIFPITCLNQISFLSSFDLMNVGATETPTMCALRKVLTSPATWVGTLPNHLSRFSLCTIKEREAVVLSRRKRCILVLEVEDSPGSAMDDKVTMVTDLASGQASRQALGGLSGGWKISEAASGAVLMLGSLPTL